MHPLLGDLYFSQDVGVILYESNQDEQISMIAAVNVQVQKRKGGSRGVDLFCILQGEEKEIIHE